MNRLRELTWKHHKRAERTNFVRRMLNRELTSYQYYVYLFNQFLMYSYLEEKLKDAKVIDDSIIQILRAPKISCDLLELEKNYGFKSPRPLVSTTHYMQYIKSIENDSNRLLAHMYVRHMGDLSGGQIIKKYVPGSGLYYHFDDDPEALKNRLRERLSEDMHTEAIVCFDMIREFMEELENSFGNSISAV